MNIKLKTFLQIISIPLTLFLVYLSMYGVWSVFDLPKDEEMLTLVKGLFSKYGLWIVFIGALIEGCLLLGQYFPGGFIIFLGVISAGANPLRAIQVVSVVCVSFCLAYSFNYFVGRYGWYKLFKKVGLEKSVERTKEKFEKQGINIIFFSYWEPNLASLTATAAGVLHVPFKKFLLYSTTGVILWNIFWGTLVYTLGEAALQIIGLKYVIIIFGTWILILLLKAYVFKRKE